MSDLDLARRAVKATGWHPIIPPGVAERGASGALLSDAQAAGRTLTVADADREAERLVRASMEYRR